MVPVSDGSIGFTQDVCTAYDSLGHVEEHFLKLIER